MLQQYSFDDEGQLEGKSEGEQAKAQSIAANLLKPGLPLSQIHQATGLTQKQVLAIKLELDQDTHYLIDKK